MPKREKRNLLCSYHVNVYEDGVEVTINDWEKTTAAKLQRTFDFVTSRWHELRRAALHEIRVKEHAEKLAKKEREEERADG